MRSRALAQKRSMHVRLDLASAISDGDVDGEGGTMPCGPPLPPCRILLALFQFLVGQPFPFRLICGSYGCPCSVCSSGSLINKVEVAVHNVAEGTVLPVLMGLQPKCLHDMAQLGRKPVIVSPDCDMQRRIKAIANYSAVEVENRCAVR